MPILLDDLEKSLQTVKKEVLPSYFSKSLTGSGKKTGLLNQNLLPWRKPDKDGKHKSPFDCRDSHTTISSGNADYEFIPMDVIPGLTALTGIPALPDGAVCVSDTSVIDPMEKAWMFVCAKNAVLKTDTSSDKKEKTLYPVYLVSMFRAEDLDAAGNPVSYAVRINADAVLDEDQFSGTHAIAGTSVHIDRNAVTGYFGSLSVFDAVVESAMVWESHIPAIVDVLIRNGASENDLQFLAGKLNNYEISLPDYWKIYDIIKTGKPDALEAACDQNLNLLLNAELTNLDQKKASIPTFQGALPYKPDGIMPSPEQLRAITTTSPCVIVQSAAGTGKSFTINHRLKYMQQCGVDLKDTIVLSFTNAAADHIKEIAPDVNSKTIASMIHDIYAMNYTHALSTIDTMLNIIYATRSLQSDPVAIALINGLRALKKDVNTGLVRLAQTIRSSFDDVIRILDMINQTTLELESIICYYAGGNLKEPTLKCSHVIMDEVQDNSIFEFIYIIRYIIRHNATLYLVGDCSQTLYEFRASNPKAMNCLEMSGVFECCQLQTNYRSNQNVLDFANLTLATIEANQFANLRLHANSFRVDDFEKNVQVRYYQLANKTKALQDSMPTMLLEAKPWIEEKLKNGEQVAFLAYKRKDLFRFEDFIDMAFPGKQLINIVPAKSFAFSFFSKYINYLGEDLQHRPASDVTLEVMRHMLDNYSRICYDSQLETLKQYLLEWSQKERDGLLLADTRLQAGTMTEEQFKQAVFDTLIAFEIEKNAMRQRLTSMNNQKLKAQDTSKADFVVSTIHSAKGLEFDNVILLYDESFAGQEENKRMYYVGLTRAKNAEWVIAYNTRIGSPILNAFEALSERKKEAAKAAMEEAKEAAKNAVQTNLSFRCPGTFFLLPPDHAFLPSARPDTFSIR